MEPQLARNVDLFTEGMPFRATRMWNDLVKGFKAGVRLKKKRWRMKYYRDCFSGSEALGWLHEHLKANPSYGPGVTRTQAQLLCQKFLERNVFVDILSCSQTAKPVFEENRLYSFVNKSSCKKNSDSQSNDSKENEHSKHSSMKVGSTRVLKPLMKRSSSYSEKIQAPTKPFRTRRGMLYMAKEDTSGEELFRTRFNSRKKQALSDKTNQIIFENSVANPVKSSHVKLAIKETSGLSRKWKSECDLNLSERSSDISSVKSEMEVNSMVNPEATKFSANNRPHNSYLAGSKATLTDASAKDKILQDKCNELWKDICLERLEYALNIGSLNRIMDCNSLSWKNVMENVKSDSRQVIEAVPRWLVSAMKCLIHWPNRKNSTGAGPDYPGFEKDVFKTICDHFQSIPEPLLLPRYLEVFTKISGLSTKCKLSAIRALQHVLLFLEKRQKQELQLLLRFMIKISKNHQLTLSNDLPTRELAIKIFVPCIFGGDQNTGLNEVLGIRITSFVMDNYCEIFKVPDGLQFQVEQRIAFCRRRALGPIKSESEQSNGEVAFCQRVTIQEYEEQKRLVTQRSLEELLSSITNDQEMNEKERKRKLKQFRETYPEIYFRQYPGDGLSMMSHQPEQKLSQVMKPLGQMKSFR